ncbi:MAG: DUF4365 domain-containing protein [Candidatus Bathyarchaeia archaeon]|jgi:hypothetical protein
MAEEKQVKPAPYSPTDTTEVVSVTIFKGLVDQSRVKLDIKERDKFPNIDGYMELVDNSGSPYGKLEVQIKKLPDKLPKIQCPTSLFAYSEKATCNPVILVGVDTESKKAFWVHVSSKLLTQPLDKLQQASVVIHFPASNVIDGSDSKYIEEWKAIVQSFFNLMRANEVYIKLLEKTNPVVGVERREFAEIQVFLDCLNRYLDGRYSIVKKVFYPTAWKLGLAYFSYKENSVRYALYPIPYGKNDVLIKEVDEGLHEELKKNGLSTFGYFTENPVRKRPSQFAMEEIEKMVNEVVQHKLLNHQGSEFIAKEFVFAFIDKFHVQMGLDEKDEYSIDEIGKAFFQYLPMWTFETIKFIIDVKRNGINSFSKALFGRPYFDPDFLSHSLTEEERKNISTKTQESIQKNLPIPVIPIGSRALSFRIFYELFSLLKLNENRKIARPYERKDFSRARELGNWVWNVFSPEALERNLGIFFDNLPTVYNQIISTNFPNVKDLSLFDNATLEAVLFSAKKEVKAFTDRPTVEFFGLSCPTDNEQRIFLSRKESAGELANISFRDFGKTVVFKGKSYTMTSARQCALDFIFEDTPMLDFVYGLIEEYLKEHFQNLRESRSF